MIPSRRESLALPREQRRRYSNPYFQSRRADRFVSSPAKSLAARLSPRVWMYGAIFVVFLIAAFWVICISSFLRIDTIDVRGATSHDPAMLESLAWNQAAKHRLLFFSQEQLGLFDTDDLKKEIEDRYAFESVKVSKHLPRSIRITVVEKKASVVWFEADAYYQVDAEGWIIGPAAGPIAGWPTLYNNGDTKVSGKRVEKSAAALRSALEASSELPVRLSSLNLRQLVVDNDRDTLKVIFSPNVIVFFSTDQPLGSQLDRLQLLVQQELKDDFKKLSYIDLRYGEKVYYK